MRTLLRLVAAAAIVLPSAAWAGGYDTPMLYSARHMGMGGAAQGYVSDPSALFHNPAGLGHVRRFSALGDFSLLLARVRSSPQFLAQDVESNLTVAPMFLLGAAYRLNDWLAVGAGVYPNASAGATYEYPSSPGSDAVVENRTRLVFIEGSPAVALNLPGRVRVGAGYRITYVTLDRFQGQQGAPVPGLDFQLKGFNWTGFRVGAQWTALDWLQIGGAYRHKTTTRVTNDEGIALGPITDLETTFVLPSKAAIGARADVGPVGFVLDVEHLWNSQNDAYPLAGLPPATESNPTPTRTEVPNVFDWKDAFTVRGGVEYRLLQAPQDGRRRLALRAGYVFDGETTNPRYPSPFGTPPGPTSVLTAGAGWDAGAFQINAAYGFRFGEGDVTAADSAAPGRRSCAFCGAAGSEPYRMRVHGLYLDVSYALP